MRRWILLVVMTLSLLGLAGPAQWLHQRVHHAQGPVVWVEAHGSPALADDSALSHGGCAQGDQGAPVDSQHPPHSLADCGLCHLLAHAGRSLLSPTLSAGLLDEPVLIARLTSMDAQAVADAHLSHLGGRDPPARA